MASYNRVILLGNLTRDIEIRYTPGGLAVTDVGLAVNDRRKTADGQWVEETTFVEVTLFGRQAEVAGEYLGKGSPILIEGRLKLDSWETSDGQKRSRLKVIGDRMQMVGGRSGGGPSGGGGRPAGAPGGGYQSRPQASDYSQPAPDDDAYDAPPPDQPPGNDIPF